MTRYGLITCNNPACDWEARLADGASRQRTEDFARTGIAITWGALTRHACSVACLVAVAAEMQREERERVEDLAAYERSLAAKHPQPDPVVDKPQGDGQSQQSAGASPPTTLPARPR